MPVIIIYNFYRIDQIEDEADALKVYKALKSNRKISETNYIKALAKCSRLIKDFIKNSKKTSIVQDINYLLVNNPTDERELNLIKYSLSQKKILFHHIKLFNNRLLKEFKNDIFSTLMNKYI